MIHIAIVEDIERERRLLSDYLTRYFRENEEGEDFKIAEFDNAVEFLTKYNTKFDIIFLDIQMPHLNGMDAAGKLREIDKDVPIIFTTSMAQFAVKGYDVNAVGFIVKPISYYDFLLRMKKAMRVARARVGCSIALATKESVFRVSSNDIYYLEVRGHTLSYHLQNEIISVYGSMKEAEEKLSKNDFMRCNSCYLVNPKAIAQVKGYMITLLNGEEIPISHPKKKAFMLKLNNWLGGGRSI